MEAADSESTHRCTRVEQHAGCAHLVFSKFLGSNDIKVVKFECMGFKVWRSSRPLSLSLRLVVAETPESRHVPTHVTFKCSFWVVWVHCSEPLSIFDTGVDVLWIILQRALP